MCGMDLRHSKLFNVQFEEEEEKTTWVFPWSFGDSSIFKLTMSNETG